MALLLVLASVHAGHAAQTSEQDILVAAAVFSLAEKVTWPDAAFPEGQDSFRVCGIGGTPGLMAALRRLAVRQIAERPVVLTSFASAAEIEYCHVLFVGGALKGALLRQILSASANAPVATVGVSKEFVELGGVFEVRPGVVRLVFEVNTVAASRAGLGLERRLTELASKVISE